MRTEVSACTRGQHLLIHRLVSVQGLETPSQYEQLPSTKQQTNPEKLLQKVEHWVVKEPNHMSCNNFWWWHHVTGWVWSEISKWSLIFLPPLQVFWVHLLVPEHGDVPDWPEDQGLLKDRSDRCLGSLRHPRQLHVWGPVRHRRPRRQRGGSGVVRQEAGTSA